MSAAPRYTYSGKAIRGSRLTATGPALTANLPVPERSLAPRLLSAGERKIVYTQPTRRGKQEFSNKFLAVKGEVPVS
jgi:hypothetical protein